MEFALLQQGDESELVKRIVQGLLLLIFFVGPLIKALLDKRAESATPKARPKRAPRPRAEADAGSGRGKEAWRELLEGRVPEPPPLREAPPKAPPKPPSMSRRVPPKPAEVEPPPRAVPLSSALPSGDDTPVTLGRLAPVPDENALESLGGDTSVERGALRSLRGLASPVFSSAHARASESGALGLEAGAAARVSSATSAGARLARRADWRRVVVLAELLAPPVTLRDPRTGPGSPPGLR